MIRALLALAALLYSTPATTEQTIKEWWQPWALGAPCSTKTDRIEGTCELRIKNRPEWK